MPTRRVHAWRRRGAAGSDGSGSNSNDRSRRSDLADIESALLPGDVEDEVAAVRQEGWIQMMRFGRLGAERRRRLGPAARCGDLHQRALLVRLKHDRACRTPRSAGARAGIADDRRRSAADRDALQLIVGEERQLRSGR